jgi:hypothetical protein
MDILQVPWVPGVASTTDAMQILKRAKRSAIVVQQGNKVVLVGASEIARSVKAGKTANHLKGVTLPVVGLGPVPGLRALPEARARELTRLLSTRSIRERIDEHLGATALGQTHRIMPYIQRLNVAAQSEMAGEGAMLFGFGPGSAFIITDREERAAQLSAVPNRFVCTHVKKGPHWWATYPPNGKCPKDLSPVVQA